MKKSFAFLEKVIDKFRKVATSQEMKGLEKYGQTLNPMDDQWDWLNMAEEELIDGYKYLNAERRRRDTLIVEALNDLEGMKRELQHHLKEVPAYMQDSSRPEVRFMRRIYKVQLTLERLSKNIEVVPIHEHGLDKQYIVKL